MVASGRCDPLWVTLAECDLVLPAQVSKCFTALGLHPFVHFDSEWFHDLGIAFDGYDNRALVRAVAAGR